MDCGGQRKHVTECNTDDALKYLQSKRTDKKQPFALQVSYYATHADDGGDYPRQYNPQPRTAHMYANETMPVPKTATLQSWLNMPWFFTDENEGRKRWKSRYDTPQHFQVTMKRYYRMASEVDDSVGAIVKELKDQGIYDNTMIIFTTDNGNLHGEHGLADKWFPQQESVRVPLVIRDPRMPEKFRGTVNDEFTLNIVSHRDSESIRCVC
jgi:arylsulfatase